VIANDRYPMAPRLKPFRGALAKLEPRTAPVVERRPLPNAARTRGPRARP
jgi:hypothetical protein